MKAMIPHHSIAILTSERAEISNPMVQELANDETVLDVERDGGPACALLLSAANRALAQVIALPAGRLLPVGPARAGYRRVDLEQVPGIEALAIIWPDKSQPLRVESRLQAWLRQQRAEGEQVQAEQISNWIAQTSKESSLRLLELEL